MRTFLQRTLAVLAFFGALGLGVVQPISAAPLPRIAVLGFRSDSLTDSWWGSYDPGVALADLLTDHLVNSQNFVVLDRDNLVSILAEHQFDYSGEVAPETAVEQGRLIGARFIVIGSILQFEHTGNTQAALNSSFGNSYYDTPYSAIGRYVGNAAFRSERITLRVHVRVVDVQTGQIVASFADEQTQKNHHFDIAAGSFTNSASYQTSAFLNSTVGHVINDEAARIASSIDGQAFGTVRHK